MTTLDDLDTPCLVLDRAKVAANAARLKAHLAALGVPLRLHVKTAKCAKVVALVLDGATAPITVSTLKEAEQFFDAGYRDILYAVGFEHHKLARAQALAKRGARLTLVVDSVAAAQGIAGFPVLIEIDTDGHRAGVKPDDGKTLIAIAQALEKAGCTASGVLTHAGGSYNSASTAEIETIAEQERAGAVAAAQALRRAGFAAPTVSIGSTPTAQFARDLAGVTEVRAGVFVFFDLVMAGIDVCRTEDLALSVMATVIGHRADKGWTLVDAGWMALSRDRGTARQRVDQGYGVVCDLDGAPIQDLVVTEANQEHGIVASRGGGAPPHLPVGTRLRILPNHACATGAQHDRYHVVSGSRELQAAWPRFSGW
ncbi:MAG: DSD1 family PLP-dependent enzyme [Betaproteobacteria bacterium]|nr:DSD1 family PLP-dependent enzyme [Betaproteobacteria bacterium]